MDIGNPREVWRLTGLAQEMGDLPRGVEELCNGKRED
jgi:hypothetical protein